MLVSPPSPVVGAELQSAVSCAPAVTVQPDGWVTVRRSRKSTQKPAVHQPLHVSNQFSLLSDTPAEEHTLVIGSSIVRNVKIAKPRTRVVCLPGARAGDVESCLKLLAKDKRRYSQIVIHAGGNDARARRSELTKINVESVCAYAKTLSDTVIFSGPLPNLQTDELYSRMSSFNRWLSRWCPANNVGYVDNWKTFWGKPDLMRRDGIHPTLDGARLISANMTKLITGLNL